MHLRAEGAELGVLSEERENFLEEGHLLRLRFVGLRVELRDAHKVVSERNEELGGLQLGEKGIGGLVAGLMKTR